MFIAQKLDQLSQAFDDSRRTVSRYLLEQGERVCGLPMADVAAETFTSKPTLVRIAKQLGFSGWPEFMRAWQAELVRRGEHESNLDYSAPFGPGTPASEILADLCRLHAEAAWQTSEIQDPQALSRAVDLLARARRIVLMGVSTNEHLLRLFERKCMLIGLDVHVAPQADAGLIACTLDARDCAVMVSYSGDGAARSPMKRIPVLKVHGVPLIGITSECDSYLRRESDVTLTILSRESLFAKIGTFSTEESISCLLDALYGALFALNYTRNLRFKTENARAVEINRRPESTEG